MFESEELDVMHTRRLRGLVLEMVQANHKLQRPHMDDTLLWGVVSKAAGFSVGKRDVLTALQDLSKRGYVAFVESKDTWLNRVKLSRIEITPMGVDLLERNREEDPAVTIS